MKWKLEEIRKQKVISFEENLDLKANLLARNPEILNLSLILAKGEISYDNGIYDLSVDLSYEISLPSSRSLEPVLKLKEFNIFESYSEENTDEEENELILSLEKDEISLDEAVADHILLEIPLQVLTSEEEGEEAKLPEGKNWKVLSEKDYKKIQEEKQKNSSAFAALGSLLDESK
ncbi:MAG: YceD family protein [Lactovum sp.]